MDRANQEERMARSSSHVITDHDEIRKWAEERGAKPACVSRTGEGEIGMIRLEFPGAPNADDTNLEEISWNDFFGKFDESNLALLVQDKLASGEQSNFNKIIGRETAEAAEKGEKTSRRAKRGQGIAKRRKTAAAASRGRRTTAGKTAAKTRKKAAKKSTKSASRVSGRKTAQKKSTGAKKKTSAKRSAVGTRGRKAVKSKRASAGRKTTAKSTRARAASKRTRATARKANITSIEAQPSGEHVHLQNVHTGGRRAGRLAPGGRHRAA
jgi:hypothetical protein